MTAGAQLAEFRSLLATRLGLTFHESDRPQLASVLTRHAAALGLGEQAYLERLGAGAWAGEQAALTEDLTITETYFFRHREQLEALREEVLPERIAARAGQRTLRMLSVGCSSGEEPYTLAIAAREAQRDPSWSISVLGLDANPAMLRQAATARYSAWSLRETPASVRDRWFRSREGGFDLADEIKASVRFARHNVADGDPARWRPAQFDVIFCRNLLMYLTPDTRAALIAGMTRALAPGGALFLGHTDSLGSRPDGLEPVYAHRTFYYRRRRSPATPPATPPATVPVTVPARRAAGQRRPVATPPPAPAVYQRAVTLLAAERLADALALVEGSPPDRPQPRDRLLHGVLLAQAGRLDEAELVARRLLDTDFLNPDAHHLLAVCLEHDPAGEVAIGQYRLAGYLDPGFALCRLRFGLFLRRRGDRRDAGPELARALELLRDERQERIVLFGGGFGRAALTALARAELDAIGAPR